MKSYNIDKNGVNQGGVIGCNIIMMRKEMYDIVGPIHAAPHRFNLNVFGGFLTIEEFRKGVTKDDGDRRAICTNSDANPSLKIRTPQTQKSVDTMKLAEIEHSAGVNEPLRLKRTKPLKREENNLEKTLGITRTRRPNQTA
jgi:hypothetical protein